MVHSLQIACAVLLDREKMARGEENLREARRIGNAIQVLEEEIEQIDSFEERAKDNLLDVLKRVGVNSIKTNRNALLDLFVGQCITLWCRMTGEDAASFPIGHPDRPGPFLRFLTAAAEPFIEAGEMTDGSLYLKARQLTGRR